MVHPHTLCQVVTRFSEFVPSVLSHVDSSCFENQLLNNKRFDTHARYDQ